jgi:hypothetical protein
MDLGKHSSRYFYCVVVFFLLSPMSFSLDEVNSIQAFRERFADLLGQDTDESRLAQAYLSEESTLWRYILAKSREDNPLTASEAMFRSTIQWRSDIEMSKLMFEWQVDNTRYKSARAKFGDLCFYGGLLKVRSQRGGPVLYEKLGKVDLYGLYNDKCRDVFFMRYNLQ